MKRTILAAALLAASGLGATAAHATAVSGLFNTSGNTLLSDNSAEYWIDRDESGTISVDDILFGILDIGDIQGTQIGGVTSYNELTIIQANKISSAGVTFLSGQGVEIGNFSAVALGAGDSNYFDWSLGTIDLDGDPLTLDDRFTFSTAFGATNDGKTLALVFEDTANNATRETDIQTAMTAHSDGDERLLVTIDTAVDSGDRITVFAPVNPILAAATVGVPNTSYEGSSFFLDGTIAQQDWPGLFFNAEITAGTGGFATPSTGSAWPIYDNIDFTVTATRVPEPASLALLGLGLCGLGLTRRRTKRA